MEKIEVEVSKRGLSALWECGGEDTSTGEVTIICSKNGEPKAPIYVRNSGKLACDKHALIPVKEGDIVILSKQHRGIFEIKVYKIIGFYNEGNNRYATLIKLAEFSQDEWDFPEVAEKFSSAIQEARAKALCYHCRDPHYIVGETCYYSSLKTK